jgi:hypothetical protein
MLHATFSSRVALSRCTPVRLLAAAASEMTGWGFSAETQAQQQQQQGMAQISL